MVLKSYHLVLPLIFTAVFLSRGYLPVCGRDLPHGCQGNMEDLPQEILKEPITTTNLALLLLDHIKCAITDERKFTRDLLKENFSGAVEISDTKFKALTDLLHKHISSQLEKYSNLELKMETKTSYLEQLVYSLQCNNQVLQNELEKHINSCAKTQDSCSSCDKSLCQLSTAEKHVMGHNESRDNNVLSQDVHVAHQPPQSLHFPCCGVCGKTFNTAGNLMNHMDSDHGPFTAHVAETRTQLQIESSNHNQLSQLHLPVCLPSMRYCCQLCEKTFLTANGLTEHTVSVHGSDVAFYTLQQPSVLHPGFHLETTACNTELHCNQCDLIFDNMVLLNLHIRNKHTSVQENCDQPPCFQCDHCDSSFQSMSSLDIHARYYHTPELVNAVTSSTPKPSEYMIAQIDGNDSLTDTSDNLSMTANLTRDTSLTKQGDIQYSYTLNSSNQSKRLVDGSNLPAFNIKYNNPQIINGHEHPTNVTMDCNSGVYLSVVKPALEGISEEWQMEVAGTIISCGEFSDRRDMSGRRVQTKVVLYLIEKSNINVKSKVVLHFHHTSTTVQVQGSSLLSCGTVSPVWLVRNFLEPLTRTRVSTNNTQIEAINQRIRQSSITTCGHCRGQVNPAAPCPKDQDLACSKCETVFHKKCTDRKKTPGNWRKSPWYCHDCLLGPLTGQGVGYHATIIAPTTPPLNYTAEVFRPRSEAACHVQLHEDCHGDGAQAEDDDVPVLPQVQPVQSLQSLSQTLPGPGPAILSLEQTQSPQRQVQQQQAQTALVSAPGPRVPQPQGGDQPQPRQCDRQYPRTQPPSDSAVTKFPSNSIRQRGTNINLTDPESEFLKTSLSACRSTIVQQEAELKRLTEALSIRERRIMQLENQVKASADVIASRDVESLNDNSTNIIEAKLTVLTQKIDALTLSTSTGPSNNIYINSGGIAAKDLSNKYTQTEDSTSTLHCKKCGKAFNTEPSLQNPTMNHPTCKACSHDRPGLPCDFCGFSCTTETDLQEHIEHNHVHLEDCEDMAVSPATPTHPIPEIPDTTAKQNL